jgi:hypothetical protein
MHTYIHTYGRTSRITHLGARNLNVGAAVESESTARRIHVDEEWSRCASAASDDHLCHA